MIVDSSALVAVIFGEAEAAEFARLMGEAPSVQISAAALVETSIVVTEPLHAEVDELVSGAAIDVTPFDVTQARLARAAYAVYGRGSGHPAQLNFGDCMTYALAKVTGEPLLFKGDDFTHTDVTSARG